MNVLEKHDKVRSELADYRAVLSVLGMFQLAEEMTTEHMGNLGVDGITVMNKYNAVWVFTKIRVKILGDIKWNDNFRAQCFMSGISRVHINVDTAIKDEEGNMCAYVRTEICPLDLDTGKLRRVSTVGIDDTFEAVEPLEALSFEKIDTGGLTEADRVRVKFTSIDYAGHTNNKEYVRFILNTYTVADMDERPVKEIEMNYIGQSYEGDELVIYRGSEDSYDTFEIKCGDVPAARCRIYR